jgi:hypothetical protein
MYLKRKAGVPKPLTDDPILRNWRFCNMYRELDTVTIWLRVNWREPHVDDPDLWFAFVVARLVNKISTLEALGYPVPWNRERFLEVMASTKKPYGAAYVISPPPGGKGGEGNKPFDQADLVLDPLWEARERKRPRQGGLIEDFYKDLFEQPGMGTFLCGQVIADVKYVEPLRSAADWTTFAAPGPGSRIGLNYLLGRGRGTNWREADWRRELGKLQRQLESRWAEVGMEPPHGQDLNNQLCEWSKHEDMRLGVRDRLKNRYDGG